MAPLTGTDLVVLMLIVWATTGLTVIHLAVIFGRTVVRACTPKRVRERREEAAAASEPLRLTFVIPVHNEEATVSATLESILAQSERADSIIVVNDGSTDGTARVLDSFRPRGITVVTMETNGGRSRALEAGLAHVNTELVAFTDADSIVHEDYVKEIKKSFRDPEVVAAAGAVQSIPHTWVTAARQVEYMLTFNINHNAETTMGSMMVLSGASSTYRTGILRRLGWEHYSPAEDMDVTWRLHKEGRKLVLNRRAIVFTSDPPTLAAYSKQIFRWYTGFWAVFRRHVSLFGKGMFGAVEMPMVVLNMTASSILFVTVPFYLVANASYQLLWFFGIGTALDIAIVVIAVRVYDRKDLWWSALSRTPTRMICKLAWVVTMVRVMLIGYRPGNRYAAIPRLSTDGFAAAGHAPTTRSR